MTFRKISTVLFSVFASIVMSMSVFAAGTLNNFTKLNEYDNEFTDVKNSDWFYESVKGCFELGLLSGQKEGVFNPNGNMTIAEAIFAAARIHEIYNGGDGVFPEEKPEWYSSALKYAIDNKIISENDFSDYKANIKRSEQAYIFANALPKEEYIALNSIAVLPDVKDDTWNKDEILLLYNAGILSGSDEYGTFLPGEYITRAASAVIINRLVNPSLRQTLSLKEKSVDVAPKGDEKGYKIEKIGDKNAITSYDGRFSLETSLDLTLNEPTGDYVIDAEIDNQLILVSAISGNKSQMRIDKYSQALTEGLLSAIPEASVVDVEALKINKHDAYKTVFSVKHAEEICMINVVIAVDKELFLLDISFRKSDYDKYIDEVNSIIHSFKLK